MVQMRPWMETAKRRRELVLGDSGGCGVAQGREELGSDTVSMGPWSGSHTSRQLGAEKKLAGWHRLTAVRHGEEGGSVVLACRGRAQRWRRRSDAGSRRPAVERKVVGQLAVARVERKVARGALAARGRRATAAWEWCSDGGFVRR